MVPDTPCFQMESSLWFSVFFLILTLVTSHLSAILGKAWACEDIIVLRSILSSDQGAGPLSVWDSLPGPLTSFAGSLGSADAVVLLCMFAVLCCRCLSPGIVENPELFRSGAFQNSENQVSCPPPISHRPWHVPGTL